jgi:hypothetical protein
MNFRVLIAICATVLAITIPALAHEIAKGPHGGRIVEAGGYHVELVAANNVADVFLTDSSDKPVAPVGFKGVAILVVGGKSARVMLEPASDGRLTGSAPGISADVKGVIQITAPGGKTAQAKFN